MNNRVEREREREKGGGMRKHSYGLIEEEKEGSISSRLKERRVVLSEKMCWLPIDQPLLLPGDSTCSARRPSPCSVAQLLASRLRRIGDQLEKSWTVGEMDSGFTCGATGTTVVTGRGHLKSFLRTAIHFTVLVLVVAKRHF